MSPTVHGWLQDCLFFFLSVLANVAVAYYFYRLSCRRTDRGTSGVELSSIRSENGFATTPSESGESSGGDAEARTSPWNLSNRPAAEGLAFSGTPCYPDRLRCRSDSWRKMNAPDERTKRLSENFMATDDARNVGRSGLTNMVVEDSSSTLVASTTAGPSRPRPHFVPRPSQELPLVDHVQANKTDDLRRRPRTASQGPSPEVERFLGICCRSDRGTWVFERKTLHFDLDNLAHADSTLRDAELLKIHPFING